mmetsp:Transcript_37813/g.84337  ORF Transcript_37813/g.84337 Transcript_37813/m.84337 type:complete len:142 (-) Transcript_37813:138-563(-)
MGCGASSQRPESSPPPKSDAGSLGLTKPDVVLQRMAPNPDSAGSVTARTIPASPVTAAKPPRRTAVECAVSLAWLQHFAATHVLDEAWSTLQVTMEFIRPATAAHACRYVDLPNGTGVPPEHVARPMYFISQPARACIRPG